MYNPDFMTPSSSPERHQSLDWKVAMKREGFIGGAVWEREIISRVNDLIEKEQEKLGVEGRHTHTDFATEMESEDIQKAIYLLRISQKGYKGDWENQLAHADASEGSGKLSSHTEYDDVADAIAQSVFNTWKETRAGSLAQ